MKIDASRSLLKKYILLMSMAIILLPFSFFFVQLLPYSVAEYFVDDSVVHYNSHKLEKEWHEQAKLLSVDHPKAIDDTLKRLKKQYPESSVFWVDAQGKTRLEIPRQKQLPDVWLANNSITFMKKSIGGNPYTVVAFITGKQSNGFMALQMPRKYLEDRNEEFYERYGNKLAIVSMFAIATIFIAFMVISYLFFNRIRKRLIRLQKAMAIPNEQTVPEPIAVSKKDEIGNLEQSFNQMVAALGESRQTEQKEESLRRQLIANLSHDLRTPLTSLRGQIYALKDNPEDKRRQEILASIDDKISYMGDLIENLLSYTLLTSHKYPYKPERTELVRLVRRSFADWYETLEAEGFEIDISLPETALYCTIDPNWFRRMMDNVIQNVVRHASSGKFISLHLTAGESHHILRISDRGPGFEHADEHSKGTGIGLSILSMMAEKMNIKWNIETGDQGSTILFMIETAQRL